MIFTSIFGIVWLVVLAYLLGFRKQPTIDASAARQVVADALPAFRVSRVEVASDGRGALLEAADGKVAMVRPHGDKWVVRIVTGARCDGSKLTLLPTEILAGATTLDLGAAAPVWARRLAR